MWGRTAWVAGTAAACGLLLAAGSCVSDATPTNDAGADAPVTPSDGGADACGLTTCGAACVDTQSDNANCGGCGKACTGADKCSEGVCGGAKAVAIATTGFASYVLLASGSVWAWGLGDGAELGVAPNDLSQVCSGFTQTWKCRSTPTRVPGLSNVTAITGGTAYGCALKGDGTVWCWGNNRNAQLGHPPGSGGDIDCGGRACNPKPTQVSIPSATGIAGGGNSTCAVTGTGDVYCWGRDEFGQSSGTLPALQTALIGPTKIPLPSQASQVMGGASFNCAVLTNTQTWCWGGNSNGILGHLASTGPDRKPCWGDAGAGPPCAPPSPVRDAMSNPFLDIWPGTLRGGPANCGITSGAKLWCWGTNESYQFGAAAPPSSVSPIQVPGTFVNVDVGDTMCAASTNDEILCWGLNELGAIGLGSTSTGMPCPWDATFKCVLTPTVIPNVKARRVVVGGSYVLAMSTDGHVWGWGLNHFGQTGHQPGTKGDVENQTMTGNKGWVSMSPVPVEGLPPL